MDFLSVLIKENIQLFEVCLTWEKTIASIIEVIN